MKKNSALNKMFAQKPDKQVINYTKSSSNFFIF